MFKVIVLMYYVYILKSLKTKKLYIGHTEIWPGGSRSIIPDGAGSTLDKMVLGRWFRAGLIRTGLPQQSANGTSKAPEGRKKRRNWLVF